MPGHGNGRCAAGDWTGPIRQSPPAALPPLLEGVAAVCGAKTAERGRLSGGLYRRSRSGWNAPRSGLPLGGAASPGSLPPESPFSGVPRKAGRPSINAADWKRNRPGLGPVLSLADAGQAGGKPPVSSGCAGLPLRAAAGCAVQSTLFLIWVRAKETKPCSALLNTVSLR